MTSEVESSRRASIYDVAREAGVSHMTVSRVLNDHPNIREATKKRVLEAIKVTNYTPSSIARALATQKAMRIGVLVDSPVQYGPNSTLRALESAARQHGYVISSVSFSAPGDGEEVEDGIAELVTQGIDAICVIAPRLSSLDKVRRKAPGLPTVIVQSEPATEMHTVSVDQRSGAESAVKHLIELGHTSILHLAGPMDWHDSRVRAQAFQETLEAAGLVSAPPIIGDWSSDSGYDVGKSADLGDATAIFASNDQMALGLIHGLQERGLKVPDDMSIVGFDDLPDARHFLPPLTTIRQNFSDLGIQVIELLVRAIEGGVSPYARELIEPKLMIRLSTGAPPKTPRAGALAQAGR